MKSVDLKPHSKSEVELAEDAVSTSLAQFESAMEHLAETVDETGQKIQHIVDIARVPKEEYERIRSLTQMMIAEVMVEPEPFIILGVGLLTGFVLGQQWMRHRASPRNQRASEMEYSLG